jgi:predicted nucleic acid-binding protein
MLGRISSPRFSKSTIRAFALWLACYLTSIKTTVSSKGQIVLPAEIRKQDRIEADGRAVRFVVDANVLSGPAKPSPNLGVIGRLRTNESEIAVDPIILGELSFGILLLRRGKKRSELEHWFNVVVYCLSWESETELRWGRLLAELRASGPCHTDQEQPDRRSCSCPQPDRRYAQPWRLRESRCPYR